MTNPAARSHLLNLLNQHHSTGNPLFKGLHPSNYDKLSATTKIFFMPITTLSIVTTTTTTRGSLLPTAATHRD